MAAPSAHATITTPGVYDNIRYANGTWQGWRTPTQPPDSADIVQVADAYDGADVHVDAVTAAGLYDNVRYANGTWQGWRAPAQPPGTILWFGLSEATDDAGNIWFVVGTTSGLYFTVRWDSTGAWSPWATISVPGNGVIGDVSASVDANDHLQVALSTAGGTLWHNIYNIDWGTWQGWQEPAQIPGGVYSIAVAGMANGDAQFMADSISGVLYHNIRYSTGTWQGWTATSQPPNLATYPSATLSSGVDNNGNAQFIITEETNANSDAYVSYHNIRYADTAWQGWRQLDVGGAPWCLPEIAVPTWTATSGIPDAHLDEACQNIGGGHLP
jgi:hypothetical protein